MDDDSEYRLTWYIEDEGERIHRVHLEEVVWPKEIDPSTGVRTPVLVDHGSWRFQMVAVDSTVDLVDLECTIDQERFSSQFARMRHFARQQACATFPQPSDEVGEEG